jgi:hypothetical protein
MEFMFLKDESSFLPTSSNQNHVVEKNRTTFNVCPDGTVRLMVVIGISETGSQELMNATNIVSYLTNS